MNGSTINKPTNLPQHIAVIMDGNRRWAKQNNLPTIKGHQKGAEAAQQFVDSCIEYGIKNITLFVFSIDNWQRSKIEISSLMKLLDQYLDKALNDNIKKGAKVKIIGDISKFSQTLRRKLNALQEKSKNNTKYCITLALSYSGKNDLITACKKICQKAINGNITLDDIDESMLSNNLMTHGLSDPDLLIRTSGESRISNFMLWQLSYTELYFSNKLWPDFTAKDLRQALDCYTNKDRRYGT